MKLYAHLFVFAILTSATFCTEPTNALLSGGRQTKSVIGPLKALVCKTVRVPDWFAFNNILKDTGVQGKCDKSNPSKFAIDYTNKAGKDPAKLYEAINIAAAMNKPKIAAALAESLINLLPNKEMATKMHFLKTLLEENRFEVFRFAVPVVYEGFNSLTNEWKYYVCSGMVDIVRPYLKGAVKDQDCLGFENMIKGLNAAFGQIAYFSLETEGKPFFRWVYEEGFGHLEATLQMLLNISNEFVVSCYGDFSGVVNDAKKRNVFYEYIKEFTSMAKIIAKKDKNYTMSDGYERDGYW